MNALPPDLFTTHLRELTPRLADTDALETAVVIEQIPAVLADPRLANALLTAIYGPPGPRLLLAWPDGALGFAHFEPGSQCGPVLLAAYAAARRELEQFHIQHAAPTGTHH